MFGNVIRLYLDLVDLRFRQAINYSGPISCDAYNRREKTRPRAEGN